MTPEQFEAFLAVMSTIDRRLANIEKDAADSAAAVDELSKSLGKLSELYVALDSRVEEGNAVMANYVDATKELRNESRQLHTLVREKLKAG